MEVRSIKPKKETGVKRMNINLETELHNRFKAATALNGAEMTAVLTTFIEDYVARNAPKAPPKKKSGRA
jgi:hypothetical protein